MSFSEIGEYTMGKWGKYATNVTLFGSQFSFVTAYVYFICSNMQLICTNVAKK